jgi:hypothetical protein
MTQTTQLERLPGTAVSTNPIPRKSCTPSRFLTVIDGQRLRCLRRQHGLSQEALADQAGSASPLWPGSNASAVRRAGHGPWVHLLSHWASNPLT